VLLCVTYSATLPHCYGVMIMSNWWYRQVVQHLGVGSSVLPIWSGSGPLRRFVISTFSWVCYIPLGVDTW